jgi:hypothetical protein
MELFKLFSQYFWLVCILIIGVNFVMIDRTGITDADRAVDRETRRRYLVRYWALLTAPWLVVGYAQLSGAVPSIWAYFRPQDGNAYVWAFYTSIFLVYVIIANWILFQDGARIASELQLVRYNYFGNSRAANPFWLKVLAIAMLPFLAFWLWLASRMDIRVPF